MTNTLAVKEHESSTGYPPDDYSAPFSLESGRDWRDVFQSPPHPCFDPEKVLHSQHPPNPNLFPSLHSQVHSIIHDWLNWCITLAR